VSCCCEEMVAEARGQLGNPEKVKRPSLEAATEKRLVETSVRACARACVCNSEL
jgi:hypothetical protein